MSDVPDVEAVHRKRRIALLDNGERITIASWVDDDGNNCAEEAAVVAIAGPCSNGKWYVIDFAEFEKAFLH